MKTGFTRDQTDGNGNRTPWCFLPRFRIRGSLITRSSLHIGSGDLSEREDIKGKDGKPVEVADCFRDCRGLPILPGTSLKGVLRARLQAMPAVDAEALNRLLGKDSVYQDPGRGGEAVFSDASMNEDAKQTALAMPHWDDEKQTWVEVINSIERERGVTADKHLAHKEVVAAGSRFDVEINGRFTDPDESIPLLLAALEGFNDNTPVTLGADTGSGKGRMSWRLTGIEKLGKKELEQWLGKDSRGMAYNAFAKISDEERERWQKLAKTYRQPGDDRTTIGMTLCFSGPFLVAHPQDIENEPDVVPRVDHHCCPVLPARSLRGVLRCHGEKILRTMLDYDNEKWLDPDRQRLVEQRVACRSELAARACKPIKHGSETGKRLCLACQLFGAAGWRSPVEIDDFLLEGDPEIQVQEFVAIDRFTGGGKESAKYSARAVIDPEFSGKLHCVNPRRMPDWGLGLLALILRDLREGRIRFGWGAAAKGYGRIGKAEIRRWDEDDFQKRAAESWSALVTGISELKNEIEDKLKEIRRRRHA